MSGRPKGAPPCADECRKVIVDGMAEMDTEVHAIWVQPLPPSGYEPLNMRCPHGVLWFMEPTSKQRARYAREGTP